MTKNASSSHIKLEVLFAYPTIISGFFMSLAASHLPNEFLLWGDGETRNVDPV